MSPFKVASILALSAFAAASAVHSVEPGGKRATRTPIQTHTVYTGYEPGHPGPAATNRGPQMAPALIPCDVPPLVGSSVRTYGWVDSSTGLAVEGEMWTFDHTGGDPWEGWTREDLTSNDFTAFQRIDAGSWATHSNGVSEPIINGSGSAWIGFHEDEADAACWEAGLGYGNNWSQRLVSPLFENSVGATVGIDFDYWYDCEPGFDSVRVVVDKAGVRTVIAAFTGQAGSYSSPLSFSQSVAVTGQFQLIFEFVSDGSYSDVDDLYSTVFGPFGVDDVDVTGLEDFGGGGPPYGFESDLEGWTAEPIPGAGIDAGLNSWASYSLGGCGQSGQVVEFHNGSNQQTAGHRERITSPPVDISGYGTAPLNIWAEYDLYADMPLADNVFWTWGFQYFPVICPVTGDSTWSAPAGAPYYFYQPMPDCTRYRSYANDTTSTPSVEASGTTLVPAGADSLRFYIEVQSWNPTDSGNESPIFDNIEIGVSDSSSIVHVPSPAYPDIWAGISGTGAGDTIVVRPGTYTGAGNRDFDFDGTNRVLVSEDGEITTVIDCEGLGRALFFHNLETNASIVDGFSFIRGTTQVPGALLLNTGGASPIIRNCRFAETLVTGSAYGVVRTDSGAPRFECVEVAEDTTVASGGVVRVTGGSPAFDTCYLWANVALFQAVALAGGTPTMDDCLISFNAATNAVTLETAASITNCYVTENSGMGMRFFAAASSFVSGTFIEGNGTGGVVLEDNSTTFSDCWIRSNYGAGTTITNVAALASAAPGAARDGAGMAASATAPIWINCTIAGNVNTASNGGGVLIDCNNVPVSTFQPAYVNCVITGNSTLFDGGGIAVCGQAVFTDIAPVFQNCTVSSNNADNKGGGIYMSVNNGGSEIYEGTTTMDRSIMWGNCAGGNGTQVYMENYNYVAFNCSDIDSNGIDGNGVILYGGEQAFEDPYFCEGPGCSPEGTIDGEFTIADGSPATSTNSPCGQLIGANPVNCNGGPMIGIDDTHDTPSHTALSQNIPNPFNPATVIRFALARSGRATLEIHDVRGRLVRTLVDATLPASNQRVVWDGTDNRGQRVSSGIYFARLRAGNVVETRKMLLLK